MVVMVVMVVRGQDTERQDNGRGKNRCQAWSVRCPFKVQGKIVVENNVRKDEFALGL